MRCIIGQNELVSGLELLIDNNTLPHFIILIGDKGSGRTTLTKWIASCMKATYTECDCRVDTVRDVLDIAYKVSDLMLYHFKDTDNMRTEAKNALLKVTEEPPEKAYFVMTIQQLTSVPDTLRSRAVYWHMEDYKRAELISYAQGVLENYDDITDYLDIATNPYELKLTIGYGKDFINYVNFVLDNIGVVESANAFKSAEKIAFKGETNKYNPVLFMRAMQMAILNRLYNISDIEDEMVYKYAKVLIVTDNTRHCMGFLCANKQQLYDMWVLDMRKALNDEIS